MKPLRNDNEFAQRIARRRFLLQSTAGIGVAALAQLSGEEPLAARDLPSSTPHFAAKAKRVIYLFQEGAPSQLELLDYKPALNRWHGTDLPESVRMGQRLTTMTSIQSRLPLAQARFRFTRSGQSGAWISELLPHLARLVDSLCIVKSMYTEAISHDPAMTFLQTGSQLPGRPSMGSWVSYGLGSESADLPAFVVLVSKGSALAAPQPLSPRLWGSGFLPAQYQGLRLRSTGDPVLYLSSPQGVTEEAQQDTVQTVAGLNQLQLATQDDPAIEARIDQYELAFRMQTSIPSLLDLSDESATTFDLYGEGVRRPGTFAANCLMARRLAERGVRFIQLYHRGWDQHNDLPRDIRLQCGDVDRPTAGLLIDLEQRGLLEDTLIVWGGEFGRTPYCQGQLTADNYGRDHHPRCFTVWLSGAGIKPGISYGETDDFGYNLVDKGRYGVHVHDLQATILHLLGVDHKQLTYAHQGRAFRLTDVHGRVIPGLLN